MAVRLGAVEARRWGLHVTSRVWVTGTGAVSPAGWSARETWEAVAKGQPCISAVQRFATFESSSRVAGIVPGREGEAPPDTSHSLEFGVTAAREALEQAGLSEDEGVDLAVVANHGERRLPTASRGATIIGIDEITEGVATAVGARSHNTMFGACAGSAQAIGWALELLRQGRIQTAVAGGTDALVREFDYFSFSSLYVMTTRDCPPAEASCPFDNRRDGFVLSEGAGFLVLETEAHGRARGAEPLAVLEGFGWSQNAYHMFAPPPDGLGPIRAMQGALRDARLDPSDVSYINAHGTSTRDNDVCETMGIRTVFGHHADRLPVSSSKSELGHAMGACGGLEAVVSIWAMQEGVIPPTINLEEPDPGCDLDYVPWTARESRLDHVMSNSFGFGGHSAALLFGRVS